MKYNLLNSSTLPTYLIAIIVGGCLLVVAALVVLVIVFGKTNESLWRKAKGS